MRGVRKIMRLHKIRKSKFRGSGDKGRLCDVMIWEKEIVEELKDHTAIKIRDNGWRTLRAFWDIGKRSVWRRGRAAADVEVKK